MLVRNFTVEYPDIDTFMAYGYAGIIFNMSIKWIEHDCTESINHISTLICDIILNPDKTKAAN